ncbi:DUF5063 domain-containing protein [Coprobacter tertius]|uniref:DUF5063 domain-containing protein n=1 Tax=Coprobacter tertius TaxID=2944915 RepID=A0ABT1MKZ8_9BACT|nr:DUF5063 domain-containing protein [Coprobacter tertius]MCP9611931.1 DUF5063 domain-containing protein [Coprobacter tertius]
MDESIYSKNTVEFVTVGVEFCSFIERAPELNRNDFIDTSIKILPLLYLKAVLLSETENDNDQITEHFVTEEIYEYIRGNIERLLRTHDSYLEVFQSDMQYSDTPIAASISEELTDIYQDIKDFVSTYSLGNEHSSGIALAICKENFISYWGQKLVNVLRALHNLRFSADTEENFDETEDENYMQNNSIFEQRQMLWKEENGLDEWDKWNNE